MSARKLSESLQVRPYLAPGDTEGKYSQNVAVYELQRPLAARNVRIAQPAQFGHGQVRSNVQWGDGSGKQVYIPSAKRELVVGKTPQAKLVAVVPTVEREHRLSWVKALERRGATDMDIARQALPAFRAMVSKMSRGTEQERKAAGAIVELLSANRDTRVAKLAKDATTGAMAKARRGPKLG